MISPIAFNFLWACLKETFLQFGANALMLRSAALSYYTIFSLPPFLLVLLQATSLFYDQATIEQTIFSQLGDYFGQQSAAQLSTTIDNIGLFEREGWSLLVGLGGVLFTSTTIFVTIQGTMNIIFHAEEASKKMGWWQYVRGRLIGLALLLSIAFILVITLTLNALITRFTAHIAEFIPDLSTALLYFISLTLPLLLTSLFFAFIFRYLPDRKIDWSTARLGAIITTILFFIGQYAITFYIGLSNTGNMYEAAGSVMVIMVWIFYASAIFYFGAQFTAVYNQKISLTKDDFRSKREASS
ncbi:MAG: YihY/virulence factor BrkB family protein [Lewinella sp.]|jgi:membrane protein|uniref:YihY/virulence factor BrkB family protein n=1 Tax=Lewinella sp. TaxID=2004506 RepID=UPI003D6A429B